ncbi:MAG: MBL fold metallo-hydrolase [Spirochaetia bacterium]|nr:MBL fold metallo-hydrolase [Spirochaetia bacterium]
MKSKILWIAGGIFALGFGFYIFMVAPFLKKMTHMDTIAYDKNLTLVPGGGGNSGILEGDNAVLVIDTKMSGASGKLYEMVRKIAGGKPIIVVNTHIHPDHVGGNKLYPGNKIYAGGRYTADFWISQADPDSMPTDLIKDKTEFKIGDETVIVKNMPYPAHTKSDIVVYLKKRKMLFTGDIILNQQAPALTMRTGVDVNGYLKAFSDLPQLFDIQKIVPGHGDIGGPELISIFKQYFADMKTAANDPSREAEMLAKYKNWTQMPVLMSNETVIKFMREQSKE